LIQWAEHVTYNNYYGTHTVCYVMYTITVIFVYGCFGTDKHIDTYMQQNKPQSSVASTVSTGCSKARSAVYICLTLP